MDDANGVTIMPEEDTLAMISNDDKLKNAQKYRREQLVLEPRGHTCFISCNRLIVVQFRDLKGEYIQKINRNTTDKIFQLS